MATAAETAPSATSGTAKSAAQGGTQPHSSRTGILSLALGGTIVGGSAALMGNHVDTNLLPDLAEQNDGKHEPIANEEMHRGN